MDLDAQQIRKALYDFLKFNPKDFTVQASPTGFGVSLLRQTTPNPTPVVKSLDIDTGPKAGGTPVTITGTGFRNVIMVIFGGVAADFNVISDIVIHATSPNYSFYVESIVDIRVFTQGGGSQPVAEDLFHYT